MTTALLESKLRWLYCLSCRNPFQLVDGSGSCDCGRSVARLIDDETIEVAGPAKALTPVETVVHLEGGEWAMLPEDLTVRRVMASAA